jgi:hypothetical protein
MCCLSVFFWYVCAKVDDEDEDEDEDEELICFWIKLFCCFVWIKLFYESCAKFYVCDDNFINQAFVICKIGVSATTTHSFVWWAFERK